MFSKISRIFLYDFFWEDFCNKISKREMFSKISRIFLYDFFGRTFFCTMLVGPKGKGSSARMAQCGKERSGKKRSGKGPPSGGG